MRKCYRFPPRPLERCSMNAAQTMTQELYNAMIAAFRKKPGNCSHVARACGVSRKRATKWWCLGSARQPEYEPIRRVLAREKAEAQAALEGGKRERRDDTLHVAAQARREAIETRAQQDKLVRMTRAASGSVLATALKLQQDGDRLADRVRLQIARRLNAGDAMTEREALSLLERISKYTRTGTDLMDRAMRLERLRLGEPQHVTALLTGDVEMTPAEAAIEIRAAGEALLRAEELGLLMLEGGNGGAA